MFQCDYTLAYFTIKGMLYKATLMSDYGAEVPNKLFLIKSVPKGLNFGPFSEGCRPNFLVQYDLRFQWDLGHFKGGPSV